MGLSFASLQSVIRAVVCSLVWRRDARRGSVCVKSLPLRFRRKHEHTHTVDSCSQSITLLTARVFQEGYECSVVLKQSRGAASATAECDKLEGSVPM
jgi:phage terminase Nu1 subunit (DNA packaging protein)